MKNPMVMLAALCAGVVASGSLAAPSEAPRPQHLLCAIISTASCTPEDGCSTGLAKDLNLPQFIRVDFEHKKVEGVRPDGEQTSSIIESSYRKDGMLVLQGMENRRGWSIAIHEADGSMTATASGRESAFAAFGACTVP